jgi:hypothetical protein
MAQRVTFPEAVATLKSMFEHIDSEVIAVILEETGMCPHVAAFPVFEFFVRSFEETDLVCPCSLVACCAQACIWKLPLSSCLLSILLVTFRKGVCACALWVHV